MNTFSVGGLNLSLPIIVGGGVCKTPESVIPYMGDDVSVGAVETGSYTPERRDGNQGVLSWPSDLGEFEREGFGLNVFGMPNCNIKEALRRLKGQHQPHFKPVVFNIAGFGVEDYVKGALEAREAASCVAALLFNLGCPNAHDQKMVPMAYDLESMDELFTAISFIDMPFPIWVALSPYATRSMLEALALKYLRLRFAATPTVDKDFIPRLAALIRKYPVIRAIRNANTLGNVVVFGEDGTPVTTPNKGQAGLSGKPVQEIVLENIREFGPLLPETTDILASASVISGVDAMRCFAASPKVKAVECASGPFWKGDGPRFFAELVNDQASNFPTWLSAMMETQPQHCPKENADG